MELPKQCIFSGSTENLNTSMDVTLDGGEVVKAWISDEFLDSATPIKVKDAVAKVCDTQNQKQSEIDSLIAKAKELGLTLVLEGVQPQPQQPQPQPQSQPQQPISESADKYNLEVSKVGNRIIDGRTADGKHISPNISNEVNMPGVSGAGSEYTITSMEKPSEDLHDGEKAEVGFIQGRCGTPVAVPIQRVGKMGRTKIKVIDSGGDVALQTRFKDLAKQEQPHSFGQSGYQVRTISCSLCKGTGKLMGGPRDCPKCDGVGLVDL